MAPLIVALMPMKVHSERVPNKNFRLLCGQPLYAWTLSALLGSAQVARVVIDTDSTTLTDELADLFSGDAHRIQVLERPEALRGDFVPMNAILAHDVSVVAADFYLQTHSTNPFLTTATVDSAITAFLAAYPTHDSLFSVTAVRTRLYDQLGRAVNHNPSILLRTQDLPPLWEENSCIYLFAGETLARRRVRIGERPLLFEMSSLESTDIDDEHDWTLAAALMPGVLAAARGAAAAPAGADLIAAFVSATVEAPAEEASPVPAPHTSALVRAQPLRPAAGMAPAGGARFDILVSAPYMMPHLPRFAAILESFGLRVLVPAGMTERLTEEQLLAHAQQFDGTICGDDAYTERVFAACAPRLKVISKWGTGIDSIDRAAAVAHGVTVCNTPGAFTNPVADSSMAYVLAFARGVCSMDAAIKSGQWEKLPGVCLAESSIGIIGLGAVGRAVAHRAAAFGAAVLAVDPIAPPQAWADAHPEVRLTTLPDVLQTAHILVLCCDLNPGSRHIIDEAALAAMRPGAILVNCARGPLVEEPALVKALQSGHIAGAGMDVFEHEPLPASSPLRGMAQVLLAPHNANASPVSHERVHWNTLKNLLATLGVPFELEPEADATPHKMAPAAAPVASFVV